MFLLRLGFFRQFESMIGDAGQQDLGIMVVQTEDLLHQPAHVMAATLVEHQDGGSGAAQCAAEQAGRTQLEDLVEAGHQRNAIRLMEAVFERGRKGPGGPGG